MYVGLSLDQAPPFEAPLKFFLTAPILATIASFIIFFLSDLNMYAYETISTVHITTIGFMLMIIFGALQQMLPVVAGAIIKKPLIIANITYASLLFGLGTFFIGFFFYEKTSLILSAFFLLIASVLFLGVCLFELIKVKEKSFIVQGMIISLVFAFLAILVGIHMSMSHAMQSINQTYFIFTNIHYNFIFVGFLFLLIVSITFQVVPMFWVTNPFNKKVQKFIIYFTTSMLILFSIALILGFENSQLYKFALFFITTYFAYQTLRTIFSRKRKLKDLSIYYYVTSMIFLILGSLYSLFFNIFELRIEALGLLWGLGFILSIMNGMLYKIVPFLAWFHLSSRGFFDIPTIRDMIPLKHIEYQFYLHLSSILAFLIYFFLGSLIFMKIGALLLAISNLYLFINLYKAARVYLKFDATKSGSLIT